MFQAVIASAADFGTAFGFVALGVWVSEICGLS